MEIQNISLENYRLFEEAQVDLHPLTSIKGGHSQGKSTLGEALPFILFGCTIEGRVRDLERDRTVRRGHDVARVGVEVRLPDGLSHLLVRRRRYTRNRETKETTGAHTDTVTLDGRQLDTAELTSLLGPLAHRDTFLSVYRAGYFMSLGETARREVVLRLIPPGDSDTGTLLGQLRPKEREALLHPPIRISLDRPGLQALSKAVKAAEKAETQLAAQLQTATKTLLGIPANEEVPEISGGAIALAQDRSRRRMRKQQAQEALQRAKQQRKENKGRAIPVRQRLKGLAPSADLQRKLTEAEIAHGMLTQIIEHDRCPTCSQPFPPVLRETARLDREKTSLQIHKLKEDLKQVQEDEHRLENLRRVHQTLTRQIEESQRDLEDLTRHTEKDDEALDLESLLPKLAINKERDRQRKDAQENRNRHREALQKTNQQHQRLLDALSGLRRFLLDSSTLRLHHLQLPAGVRLDIFEEHPGGEIEECCKVYAGGLELSCLADSEQTRVGYELCKSLRRASGRNVPIWVDRMESCNLPLALEPQTILARVTHEDSLVITPAT